MEYHRIARQAIVVQQNQFEIYFEQYYDLDSRKGSNLTRK